MKNVKSIVGLWNGVYTYDSDEYNGVSIRFTMSLNIKDGELIGKCYDTVDDGGIPEPANIKGFIDGVTISLNKQYPHLFYRNEAGEYRIDENQPHPEIHYIGEIENGSIKGTWEMILGSFDQDDEIVEEAVTGKWEMRKETKLYWA